jgi:Ca-activated chloride channel family protein
VKLSADFPTSLIVELPFPANLDVVNRILMSYLNDQRLPAHSYFLLDVSGSMQGQRLGQVQVALNVLAGDDSSLTGRFARFQNRELVSFVTFSSDVNGGENFALTDPAHNSQVLRQIQDYGASLQAGGATALFSSLQYIYGQALAAQHADPRHYYSIVVMTDGMSNRGESWQGFRSFYEALSPADQTIKVFPIVFGEADRTQLQAIAQLTGGRLFDGNTGGLASVFKEIRGYQ